MLKAKRPGNYFANCFTHNQAEQIKKIVICVQMLLEIHQSKHGKVHFQGWLTAFTHFSWTQKRRICTVGVI